MTWPFLMPPPASRAIATRGQWSRPTCLLIIGVQQLADKHGDILVEPTLMQVIDECCDRLVEDGKISRARA